MKFTYRLIKDANGWLAECVESDAAGEGKTSAEAIRALKTSLEERMFRPDAVAPPSRPEPSAIELELANDTSTRTVEPSGPGG